MTKIVCRLKGGLGNQLFIYASAFALSKILSLELQLDIYSGFWFDRYKRHYNLGVFPVPQKKCSFILSILIKMREKLNFSFLWSYFDTVVVFIDEKFDLFKLKGSHSFKKLNYIIIDDIFQNENLFKIHRRDLKDRFSKLKSMPEQVCNTLEQICSDKHTAICLHGRLLRAYSSNGKMVHNGDARVVTYTYYDKSVLNICSIVENPHFFIFSDSPQDFIKQINLQGRPFTVIHHELSQFPEVDFSLMCACQHFIISNSTYSWWAAWLSEKPHTIIISPERKFWDEADTVPNHWTIIKS